MVRRRGLWLAVTEVRIIGGQEQERADALVGAGRQLQGQDGPRPREEQLQATRDRITLREPRFGLLETIRDFALERLVRVLDAALGQLAERFTSVDKLYATALAETDTPQGWRPAKANGGVLIDVA
jgi:hypothetical protein